MRLLRAWRCLLPGRLRSESGLTVAEMAVGTALMGIVIAMTGSVLVNDLFRVSQVEAESQSVTELRTALGRIERDIRSADCVYAPLPTGPGLQASGARLEMDTRAGGTQRHLAYEVSEGKLMFRDFDVHTNPEDAVTLFEGLDGASAASTFLHTAPNAYAADPSEPQYSRIHVTLVRDVEDVNHSTERMLDTVVTARNADVIASGAGGCGVSP